MVIKKPRIVIIGAGMAGLSAANKLFKCAVSKELFELLIVEGGTRIGGRIKTSEFCDDRIEMGATWIHGIGGSPIHQIAQEINSLESEKPWECMDSLPDEPLTIAEGGFKLSPSIVEPINYLFNKLMDFAQGKSKSIEDGITNNHEIDFSKIANEFLNAGENDVSKSLSLGSFLRKGLDAYLDSRKEDEVVNFQGSWNRKSLESAIFSMLENTQRTYTSAGDLNLLDFIAESEYRMFPGEEITIAQGYFSIIESLASVLPPDTIQFGRKVSKIEWNPDVQTTSVMENSGNNGYVSRPVMLHFVDGSSISADHVIVTVSLGVLKHEVCQDSCFFSPSLPKCKIQAISRLGFGVVNKLFLQLNSKHDQDGNNSINRFPFLQMVFHQEDSTIPWWMRRTASLSPIYSKSNVLLSWFAGEEALALETLSDEQILDGVSATISDLMPYSQFNCNGTVSSDHTSNGEVKFGKVLKSTWGADPLFLGSYSYVAVGSSGDDLDTMAEPLPKLGLDENPYPLQILFAGEATHRTHYSTTHGAYFSGIREANRLLQHYKYSNDV
ncbi:oxidase [Lithospermum erythrorhizon]|uniref:Oxidase n=1 Tax=Lithospermum erythrorhizon TaxID=34254 RepID=A0AAV3RC23_LITER